MKATQSILCEDRRMKMAGFEFRGVAG